MREFETIQIHRLVDGIRLAFIQNGTKGSDSYELKKLVGCRLRISHFSDDSYIDTRLKGVGWISYDERC
jgi:hypothetical protein